MGDNGWAADYDAAHCSGKAAIERQAACKKAQTRPVGRLPENRAGRRRRRAFQVAAAVNKVFTIHVFIYFFYRATAVAAAG
ncbi:hypothetical protein [Neisseria shayeganii]|uniref:Uncharacterized protein n=1 Tax=Neisseria shayeganii TaxID=607712 RepID=A0A7D7SQH4_9NEIS|nr:hypothetical protein [Neisseria shayeganii]QMT41050.1 hypothetical protein H3L94_03155 [Neisseria shayeganii]